MPALGRRPLEYYSTMDTSQSSQSSPSSGSSGRLDSPRASRSKSPKKQPSPNSPYRDVQEDLHRVRSEYGSESVYTRRSADPLYPNLPASSAWLDPANEESARRVGDGAGDVSRTPERNSLPARPPRKNQATAQLNDYHGSGDRVGSGALPAEDNNPLLWTIVGCSLAAIFVAICWPYLFSWWKLYSTPTAEETSLERFESKFRELERDFKDEVHPESFELLHNALEHHVRTMSDSRRTYPTCVMIAGDRAGAETLNCLADRIASIIPAPVTGKASTQNVHVVNLKDDHHDEHKNPDMEDRRSRVHTGINEGISEGAKIIMFQNLEALIPNDIPLLQLFYSYCDGENPTFPKTLWILTVGTTNVTYLEGHEAEQEQPGFARSAKKKVEDFLEKILSTTKKVEGEVEEKVESITRNPILTRIANYIVPVLRTKAKAGQCIVSDRRA